MSKVWGRPQTGRFRIAHGIIDVYMFCEDMVLGLDINSI
jgi:hypothetical protein